MCRRSKNMQRHGNENPFKGTEGLSNGNEAKSTRHLTDWCSFDLRPMR